MRSPAVLLSICLASGLAACNAGTAERGNAIPLADAQTVAFERPLRFGPALLHPTEDERALRQLARVFLEPAWRADPGRDADLYAAGLIGDGGGADWDRIQRDIARDEGRMVAFVAVAARVLAADVARVRTRAPGSPESTAMAIRAADNRTLVRRLRQRLAGRLGVYRHTLGQLVLLRPDPRAITAEETLTELEWRLRRLPSA